MLLQSVPACSGPPPLVNQTFVCYFKSNRRRHLLSIRRCRYCIGLEMIVEKGRKAAPKLNKKTLRGDRTRTRILNVAEQLFSQHGIDGVSMRTLVARSKVNLSSVNYYFGSKDALFEQVFARRARVITEKRIIMLAECRAALGRPPLVSQILEAFLRPVMESDGEGGGAAYARFRIRLAAERSAWARDLPSRYFDESSHQFLDALAAALPHIPIEDIYWRFNIMLAAMYFTIANPARIEYLSRGLVDMSDEEQAIVYLVQFFSRAFGGEALVPALSRKSNKQARRPGPALGRRRYGRTPANPLG
jgi:AcrR family transcriptional regulator